MPLRTLPATRPVGESIPASFRSLANAKCVTPTHSASRTATRAVLGAWERRGGEGRNVTFPARQYSINGERRSFALLRPIVEAAATDGVRDADPRGL
jgi:hypothetical protein